MSIGSAIVLSAAGATGAIPVGTVTVAEATGDGIKDQDGAAFVEAVDHALGIANFVVLSPAGPSRYRAAVVIDRETRGLVDTPAPAAGPRVDVANWGAGVRVTLPTRKRNWQPLVVTRMTITLTTRRDGRTVWTGSALTAQADGTQANEPGVVGAKLATALMSRFPATLDGPMSVP